MQECIVCGNTKFSSAAELNKDLIRCNRCNLIFYNDIHSVSPGSIYSKEYFETIYYDYILDKLIIQKNFANRLKTIKKFVKNGRLLEIGAAYGFFLELAMKEFEVYGIDVAGCSVKYAKDNLGIPNMACGDYLDAEYKEGYFDAVCLFDTIEHLKEPQRYLEKASKELKSRGVIFITTGDIGSVTARFQKRNWRLIKPPEHLFYFSYDNLRMLLERYGFEVAHKEYIGYYRSLAAIVYLSFLKSKKIFSESAFFKLMERIPVYLNLYDIVLVAARKK